MRSKRSCYRGKHLLVGSEGFEVGCFWLKDPSDSCYARRPSVVVYLRYFWSCCHREGFGSSLKLLYWRPGSLHGSTRRFQVMPHKTLNKRLRYLLTLLWRAASYLYSLVISVLDNHVHPNFTCYPRSTNLAILLDLQFSRVRAPLNVWPYILIIERHLFCGAWAAM